MVSDLELLRVLAVVLHRESVTATHYQYEIHGRRRDEWYSHSLVVSSIVSDELCGRDEDLRVDGLERIDQTSALLSDSLERVAVGLARGHALRGGLEDRARVTADIGPRATLLEKQRGDTSHERRGHRRARKHSVGAHFDGVRRQDVTTGGGDRGLEVEVVRRAVGREVRDEATVRVGVRSARAGLGEGDRDLLASRELLGELWA